MALRTERPIINFCMTLVVLLGVAMAHSSPVYAATCLWVSSYHQGYEWEDGIGRGIAATLTGHCKVHRFLMDTKRNPDPEFGRKQGAQAFALVKSLKPDVIIASDDNASRYFVKPHLQNMGIPVVFCGINWTVAEYGYPSANSTGMVEFAPAIPLLEEIRRIIKNPVRGLYLSTDVSTEHIEFSWYKRLFAEESVIVDSYFVQTLAAWEKGYLQGQNYDFMILGPNAGINDWDQERAKRFALQHAHKLTVTTYDWMMPYTMMAMSKSPDEQGAWAGNVALEILRGMAPADIPIVPNRRWNLFVNLALVKQAGIKLRPDFLISAIKVRP